MAFEYKVAWHSHSLCNQGWVEIVKNKLTEELFFCCSECDAHWRTFEEIEDGQIAPEDYVEFIDYKGDLRDIIIKPTRQEIANKGWEHYIITDWD